MSDYLNHPDYRALLAAVTATPADDLPRLVLADWLEEHGQSDRAEFIRVQIGYARVFHHAVSECPRAAATSDCPECQQYLELSPMYHSVRFRPPVTGRFETARDCPDRLTGAAPTGGRAEWDWHRGFVVELRCPLSLFVTVACGRCWSHVGDARYGCGRCKGYGFLPGYGLTVLPLHPVETITLSDVRVRYAPGSRQHLPGSYSIDWPSLPHDHPRKKAVDAAAGWMRKFLRDCDADRFERRDNAWVAVGMAARAWAREQLRPEPVRPKTFKW